MIIIWSKLKAQIRKHPRLLGFFKFFTQLPVIATINKKLSPPTERFDARRGDAEIDYVDAYSHMVVAHIKRFKKDNSLLIDIGCGYGYVTKILSEISSISHIYAIDKISEKEFRNKNEKITYLQRDITNLDREDKDVPVVDIVSSTEFIEHISEVDAKNLLGWIHAHLRDGGMFVGSTPKNTTDLYKYSDSPFHIREYSIKDFVALLSDKDFSDIEIEEREDFFVWKAIVNKK